MKGALQRAYKQLQMAYLGPDAVRVPPPYRSTFICYGGSSEVQYIVGRLVPASAKRVLVVGVFGGRDYFYLKLRGMHDVHAVDLMPISGFDNLAVANVEEGLPYPDQFFDAIVTNEVLEHLLKDNCALGHLRRVLKDDGTLVLSVPFLHQSEPTHLRVHTRVSLERLLASCGFQVRDVVERPGLGCYISWINVLNHVASLITFWTIGITVYGAVLPHIWRLEYVMGHRRLPWRRFSRAWGAYVACQKTSQWMNYLAMNQQVFGPPPPRHGA